jgi:hypothetical protein
MVGLRVYDADIVTQGLKKQCILAHILFLTKIHYFCRSTIAAVVVDL